MSCNPSLQPIRLGFLVRRTRGTPHLLMCPDMAGNAKQAHIIRIKTELLHLLLSLRRFNRHNMMAVHSRSDDAFLQTILTQAVGSQPHRALCLCPTLRVEQSLVSFISAHGSTSKGLKS